MHPVLLTVGRYEIASYGVLISLGMALSAWVWYRRRVDMGLKTDEDYWLLLIVVMLGVYLGAHVWFAFEYKEPLTREFWRALANAGQGFVYTGSIVATLGGLIWFCRRAGVPLLRVLDYILVTAPIGHGFGRLGCFAAGCCFGRPAGRLPWAVTFVDPRSGVDRVLLGRPLHPTQLYEAGGELIIFLVLYFGVLPRVETGRLPRGAVCAGYLFLYGVLRFVDEFYRADAAPFALGLTTFQAVSVGLFFVAGAILAFGRKASSRAA